MEDMKQLPVIPTYNMSVPKTKNAYMALLYHCDSNNSNNMMLPDIICILRVSDICNPDERITCSSCIVLKCVVFVDIFSSSLKYKSFIF